MSYCTTDDLAVLFSGTGKNIIDFTNPDGNPVIADAGEAIISEVSGIMDTYISQAAPLPLDIIPQILVWCCRDLAAAEVYRRVSAYDIPEYVRLAQTDAYKLLGNIAAGKVDLGISLPTGVIQFTANTQVMDGSFV